MPRQGDESIKNKMGIAQKLGRNTSAGKFPQEAFCQLSLPITGNTGKWPVMIFFPFWPVTTRVGNYIPNFFIESHQRQLSSEGRMWRNWSCLTWWNVRIIGRSESSSVPISTSPWITSSGGPSVHHYQYQHHRISCYIPPISTLK